jgi:drug/metabolite transporter (DMT)-like permease
MSGLEQRPQHTNAVGGSDNKKAPPMDVETANNNNNDDNQQTNTNRKDHRDSLASKSTKYLLQIGNIMLWYYTNGMNGISMQSYSNQLVQARTLQRFLATWTTTNIVTSLQLLLGAALGRTLLFFINRKISTKSIASTHSRTLSGLHATGSLATNLGFMYGKASVIQVLKLLEPFETLILSQLLFREGVCSAGVVSSMIVVVGSAMSLLKLQQEPPVPQAVIFALVSGLTLSCRNVLQRKHHHTTTTQEAAQQWSTLEKSIVQFTQLSFFSGLWTAGVALTSLLLLPMPLLTSTTAIPDIQVLIWHPLYNVFSMITLGFCSALTHSLLNAGKRVFSIVMAMLWFSEGLNAAMLAGLLLVGMGGIWYDYESKQKKKKPSSSDTGNAPIDNSNNSNSKSRTNKTRPYVKVFVAIGVVYSLGEFQQQ